MFEKTDEGTVFFNLQKSEDLWFFSHRKYTVTVGGMGIKTETFNQGTEVEFG